MYINCQLSVLCTEIIFFVSFTFINHFTFQFVITSLINFKVYRNCSIINCICFDGDFLVLG